jgi:hypothetical protein
LQTIRALASTHKNTHHVVDVDVEVEVHGEEGIVDEEEEEEYERVFVDRSDPFWDQVLTDDSDAYDLDANVGLEYDDVRVDEVETL